MSATSLGFRNLARRKSRTALTFMGVALAIGFTVGLLSVSEGFMRSVRKTVVGMGPDLVVLGKGQAKMPFLIGASGTFPEEVAKTVANTPGVNVVEPVYQALIMQGEMAKKGIPTAVVGITPETFFPMRSNVKIGKGRALRPDDGMVCVLGAAVAQNLNVDIGDKVELAIPDAKLEVVGVLEDTPYIHGYYGFANIRVIQKIYDDPGRVHFVLAKVDDIEKAKQVRDALSESLPENDVETTNEMVGQIQQMFMMARALHIGLTSFSLLIGALFVATTMIMAVFERIREFAALRVIGASKAYVTRLIMTESIILCALGGLSGCLLGVLLSRAVDALIAALVGNTFLKAMVTPRIFAMGLIIALLIGVVAGLAPTRLILKRNLSESLKYE